MIPKALSASLPLAILSILGYGSDRLVNTLYDYLYSTIND